MTILEAIENRHSVRAFTDKKIDNKTVEALCRQIEEINCQSGLNLQLCTDEPEAFCAGQPHYGRFENCRNYIALVAKPGSDEKIGYYGEQLVLIAQILGLKSCWVILTFKKGKTLYKCESGEKLRGVIALGYGKTGGVAHKSKEITKLCRVNGDMPDWFKNGMNTAILAPTAVNQQKFLISLDGNTVTAKSVASIIGNTKLDLGIVKYHFEIGAGKENFKWN